MNNFISSIKELSKLMVRISTEEYRGIKNTLLYLLITFYSLCLLQWLFGSHVMIRLIGYTLCFGSMMLLFRIPRFIKLAGLGEVLETFRLTRENPGDANDKIPDILENQLVKSIWDMTEKLFFLYAMSCLIIPVLPIRNNPEIIPVFTIAAVTVFLFIWRTGGNWVRPIGLIIVLAFLVIHIAFLFPQVKYYFNKISPTEIQMPEEVFKTINNFEELKKKQKVDRIKQVYQKAINWQKDNPTERLPKKFEEEIEAAKKNLSVKELRLQKKDMLEAQKRRALRNKLIETVNLSNPDFPRQMNLLPPGKYRIVFDPETAATGAKVYLLHGGKTKIEKIKNNRIIVQRGEKGFAIWTDTISIARIYTM